MGAGGRPVECRVIALFGWGLVSAVEPGSVEVPRPDPLAPLREMPCSVFQTAYINISISLVLPASVWICVPLKITLRAGGGARLANYSLNWFEEWVWGLHFVVVVAAAGASTLTVAAYVAGPRGPGAGTWLMSASLMGITLAPLAPTWSGTHSKQSKVNRAVPFLCSLLILTPTQ